MTANDSDAPKMSRNQEKGLAALLSERTIAAAAQSAGISEATLLRWLKEETFANEYRAARREVVSHAITQLQSACSDAVAALCSIAEDATAPASSRVAAARTILDTSIKAVELEDLAARIERLEQMQAAMQDSPANGSNNGRWNR
jgi:DNA-binding MurR/RpiR family transcriptional regulator